jgi:hypothetical protein
MRRAVLVSMFGVVAVVSVSIALIAERTVLAENGAVAAVTVRSAGEQEYVKIVASNTTTTFTTVAWVTLTSAAINFPAGHTDLLIADFVCESYCSEGTSNVAGGGCNLRLRVGSTDLYPQAGSSYDLYFDTDVFATNDTDGTETHAASGFICLAGGGGGQTYRIYVDAAVSAANMDFELDDWTLRLTRSHGCATS